MASRDVLTPPLRAPESEEAHLERISQRKRPEAGRFRLEVDRQLKGSFTSFEAAQAAGQAIKVKYPIVKVAIYDAFEGINTVVEPPAA